MIQKSFNSGSLPINYAEGPANGPPLVLLHGGSARWQSFTEVLPNFGRQFHCFAPDLRGHGQSGWARGQYRLLDYAQDIEALIDQEIRKPGLIFGHSLGGMIGLMVATSRPAWVKAVMVGDSPLTNWADIIERDRAGIALWRDLAGGHLPVPQIIERLKDSLILEAQTQERVPMRQVFGEADPVYDWFAQNLYQQDPEVLTVLLEDFGKCTAGYNIEPILSQLKCPLLLLQADPASGGFLTDDEIYSAKLLRPELKHVRLHGVGHALHHVHKSPVLREIAGFLRAIGYENEIDR